MRSGYEPWLFYLHSIDLTILFLPDLYENRFPKSSLAGSLTFLQQRGENGINEIFV